MLTKHFLQGKNFNDLKKPQLPSQPASNSVSICSNFQGSLIRKFSSFSSTSNRKRFRFSTRFSSISSLTVFIPCVRITGLDKLGRKGRSNELVTLVGFVVHELNETIKSRSMTSRVYQ